MPQFDVIVVGLGAVGSAATYQLAKRGQNVLGIDRYPSPHRYGSTHGETRITRVAIGEGMEYTPLARRSNQIWRDLERATAQTLFNQCGCLTIPSQLPGEAHGIETATFFANIEAAQQKFGVDAEMLPPGEVKRRYPALATQESDRAVLDREGGYLFVERCVSAQCELARGHGATLRTARMTRYANNTEGGVRIFMADGSTADARKLILAGGPWMPDLVPALKGRLTVTRQVLHWFEIKSHPERFGPGAPVFMWLVNGLNDAVTDIYGFPYIGGPENGVKIAYEIPAPKSGDGKTPISADPDAVSRVVTEAEIDKMYRIYTAPFVPDLGRRSLRTEVCLYTEAPKGRFIIDSHPDSKDILYASACSGHGFKHSAALGEALAEMAMEQQPEHVDLSAFALRNLPPPSHPAS